MESNICLENIHFSYGTKPALKNISLQLKRGNFYGIIGPNGCGKSTLLDLLCGYRKATRGRALLNEQEYASLPQKKLAQEIALVPQEFDFTLGFTVEEIVLMGRHPHISRFASPGPKDFAAVHWAMEVMGLQSLQKSRATTLSGGQKQRTIVARALAQKSNFLLFDEATANLDIHYSLQIFSLAKRLSREESMGVVAVLHDLHLAAAYCDELIVIQNGEIAAMGSVAEIMNPEIIAEIFQIKSSIGIDRYGQENQPTLYYPQS